MAGLFKSLGPRSSKQSDSETAKRAAKTQVVASSVKGGTSLLDKISTIISVVATKLGKYKEHYQLIRTEEEAIEYFDKIIESGIAAIDTETNSLDPITCTLAGVCLYTPGSKPAYIPVNHVSYITGAKSPNQVDAETLTQLLKKCQNSSVKWIMHHAKFDIRVIKNQLGIKLKCYWDTMLAAKCINENESAALKYQHITYCESKDTEALSYDKLFEGIPFTHIPITTGYLYAAGDGVKTFELYEVQKTKLNRRVLPGPYSVYTEIEMPLVPVIADMEDTGVPYDSEYNRQLSEQYTAELKKNEEEFYKVLSMYETEIEQYKQRNPGHKLSDPINIASPTQIAIILYDILQLKSMDKNKPRGTGEDILLALNIPLSQAILNYRGTAKLLSTYIDNMPKLINPKTGRVHTSFNQYGAVTGRVSSSDPNMQNIPAKNKDIRKQFTASEGYALISTDFSQQEPRTLAHMSGDDNLIKAYADGKDIYSWIAQSIYNVPYDECKEFRMDGTKNPEGKKRRDSVKSIILGIMYDRGAPAIAEQLGVPVKEAQKIIDKFFTAYPKVKIFIENTVAQAKITGFVETAWGRMRRLPDMLLPLYEFRYKDGKPANFDPLNFDAEVTSNEVEPNLVEEFTARLNKAYSYKEKQNIKNQIMQQGIIIKDNGGFISEATRQCVNSRIQGSGADLTKLAMIAVHNDEQLREWGYRLLLQVHDELIGESPIENARKCGERICQLMVDVAKDVISVPMKVDAEITDRWYGVEVA